MAWMSTAEFEARYRADPDPWRYASSPYERAKYAATLRACGPGPFDSALELGGSIGVFSATLAPRCRCLTTIDGAATAVAMARRRLRPWSSAEVVLGEIPRDIPRRRYDLVVASEILYYLQAPALDRLLALLREQLVASGRLVAVHWTRPGPERPFDARQVHARLLGERWLAPVRAHPTQDYLLDVLERR